MLELRRRSWAMAVMFYARAERCTEARIDVGRPAIRVLRAEYASPPLVVRRRDGRKFAAVAANTLELSAEKAVPSALRRDPVADLPRRIVADVLSVAACELRDP